MKYEAVLFDMDGTLIETGDIWKKIDIQFFKDKNIDYDVEKLNKELEGLSINETAHFFVSKFDIEENEEQLLEYWNNLAMEFYTKKIPAKKGCIEFLKRLKEDGVKMAIGTSNSYVLAKAAIDALGISPYIDVLLTANECKAGKPDPDVYLQCAKRLGADPCKCIVFEDVLAGLMAGKAAGAKTVVMYDELSAHNWEEKKAFADYNYRDYFEVLEDYEILFN